MLFTSAPTLETDKPPDALRTCIWFAHSAPVDTLCVPLTARTRVSGDQDKRLAGRFCATVTIRPTWVTAREEIAHSMSHTPPTPDATATTRRR
eukprot:6332578-Pyramimonas_sp.AAC.2